jgi:nucleolar complex protein 2
LNFILDNFRSKENGVSALEQHKKDLADLATVDPEFYKFLKKEDAGLLDFDVNEDDESIPDDDPEQQAHQLPEQLAEMDPFSDEVHPSKLLSKISVYSFVGR